MKKAIFENRNGLPDLTLLISVILLSVYGTVMVFSAGGPYAEARYGDAYHFIKRQIIWLAVGIVVMLLSSRMDIDTVMRLSPWAYLITLLLLILTLAIGFVGNGAQRWISLGPITIQPSEIAKLSMIMMLAYYFSKKEGLACFSKERRKSFIWGTLIPCGIMLIPIVLVMLQHHLSAILSICLPSSCWPIEIKIKAVVVI